MKSSLSALAILIAFAGCQNREINDREEFKPREIHSDVINHFDMIVVDGVEYLILEKDNNNPHEGFGFMALRGNKLIEKQDTMLAYLRTLTEIQTRMYALQSQRPLNEVQAEVASIFKNHLQKEATELRALEQRTFTNDTVLLKQLPKVP